MAYYVEGSNNLLKIKGRTPAPYDGNNANTSIRNFSEDYYYVGITGNNYWGTWAIEQYLVGENKVQLQSESGAYGIGFPVKCKPNTNYSISFIGENRVHITVGFYTKNGEMISWTLDSVIGDKGGFFTTPENCYWISICFKSMDPTQIGTFTNIMLNKGETALPYEPYRPQTVKKVIGAYYNRKRIFATIKKEDHGGIVIDGVELGGLLSGDIDKEFFTVSYTKLNTVTEDMRVDTDGKPIFAYNNYLYIDASTGYALKEIRLKFAGEPAIPPVNRASIDSDWTYTNGIFSVYIKDNNIMKYWFHFGNVDYAKLEKMEVVYIAVS